MQKNKHRWGSWSEWTWDDNRQSFYRARQDVDGNLDYQWEVTESQDNAAPRRRDRHPSDRRDQDYEDNIARQLTSTHLDDEEEAHSPQYTTTRASEAQYAQDKQQRAQKDRRSERPRRPERPGEPERPDRPGRGDPYDRPGQHERPRHSERPGHSERPDHSERPSNQSRKYRQADLAEAPGVSTELALVRSAEGGYSNAPYGDPPYGDAPYDAQGQYVQGYHQSSRADNYYPPREVDRQYEQERYEEEEFRAAQADSKKYHYLAGGREYDYEAGDDGAGPSTSAYEPYENEEEGRLTPKGRDKNQDVAEGFMKGLEELDPRYKIEHSGRFQPGDIFKVYWAEPAGHGKDSSTVTSKQQVKSKYGIFWVGFRRFIVIANDEGNCTCLPILTYSGKGGNKKGIKANKHGIVYQKGHKAHRLQNEPPLGLPPIAATMTVDGEKLAKASRVNYAKLVTIEHNTPVFFIGYISGDDFDLLVDGQNKIWAEKNVRRKQGHGHGHGQRRK